MLDHLVNLLNCFPQFLNHLFHTHVRLDVNPSVPLTGKSLRTLYHTRWCLPSLENDRGHHAECAG